MCARSVIPTAGERGHCTVSRLWGLGRGAGGLRGAGGQWRGGQGPGAAGAAAEPRSSTDVCAVPRDPGADAVQAASPGAHAVTQRTPLSARRPPPCSVQRPGRQAWPRGAGVAVPCAPSVTGAEASHDVNARPRSVRSEAAAQAWAAGPPAGSGGVRPAVPASRGPAFLGCHPTPAVKTSTQRLPVSLTRADTC